MITTSLLKYNVFSNNIRISNEVKNIIDEEKFLRQGDDNINNYDINSIQDSLYINNSSYINRCVDIESIVQDYQFIMNSYEHCTQIDNIEPFTTIYNIADLYTGPLIYNDQIYDYEQYIKFRDDMKHELHYDILSRFSIAPYSRFSKIYIKRKLEPNITYTEMLNLLNYLIDLVSTKYISFLTMMSDDNTNPIVKAETFSTQRTILENKITELKDNSKSIGNFKDLVLYAKNNLDIWFGYKTEVENKLINISNNIQNISSDTIYLSEEYYNFNSISHETNIYNLGALSNYISENNILSSDIVFRKAYKMYINNQEIYLYEYAYYHNNIIIK